MEQLDNVAGPEHATQNFLRIFFFFFLPKPCEVEGVFQIRKCSLWVIERLAEPSGFSEFGSGTLSAMSVPGDGGKCR